MQTLLEKTYQMHKLISKKPSQEQKSNNQTQSIQSFDNLSVQNLSVVNQPAKQSGNKLVTKICNQLNMQTLNIYNPEDDFENEDLISPDDFTIIRKLGSGAFGTVSLVMKNDTQQ